MKRYIFAFICLLSLTISCTPTPPQQAVLVTATPALTNAPMPTAAPTNTPTPTAIPTNTPAPTAMPTITPTPTEILMPELEVSTDKSSEFIADGKEVILRGAVAPHFIQDGRRVGGLPQFKKDVQTLKSWNGNFVSVVWNSGYIGDNFYVESLMSALEFARSLGLRVELVLHSRGLKTVNGGQIKVDPSVKTPKVPFLKCILSFL
jgi:hypothetical protein